MKVLLVNGSPKEKNNTYTALKEAATRLENQGISAEIFWLGNAIDGGCRACKACQKTGKCVHSRDAVNTLIEKAAQCDGFIFGTPVHYASASGNITAALDRAFYAGAAAFRYKPAASIAVLRRAGSSAAIDQLNKYFSISCMPIVSSTYWNMVHGSTPEQIQSDLEGMQTVRNLADNMAWLLYSIEAGKKAGVKLPIADRSSRTDFIR